MDTNINDRLERSALGEGRFNPDEQKKYLNTFRERIILTINFEDAKKKEVIDNFDPVLSDIEGKYDNIAVKINGNLSDSISMKYKKIAKDHNIPATIISTPLTASRFGVIVHSNIALNADHFDIYERYTNLLKAKEIIKKKKKEGFLKRLFK
ncbi:DUF1694 domain-containing protein [Streptococcaceae bacterium ESL0687]|nr:DUF1694 domain-containing protein [Streptococcaceae bacterium ESL0687]